MTRSWKLEWVTANKEVIYFPYPVSSCILCGKAKVVALTVRFQAILQSPPFLTTLVGSTAPKESSRSPNLSTLRSSFVVESCPLRTASRLTKELERLGQVEGQGCCLGNFCTCPCER